MDALNSLWSRIRVIFFIFLLIISSFFGCIFLLAPLSPLIVISPKFWRYYTDRIVGFWFTLPVALCVWLFGVDFHLTGDRIIYGEPALIIMNHRTRLDWLFLWNCLYKIDPWLLVTEKISLKASLKHVPVFGWAISLNNFMSLCRKWKFDKMYIENMIRYYADVGQNYQLLLFPEGSDMSENAISISHSFALKNNLQDYRYLLHPRTSGFVHIVKMMRSNNYFGSIYDVTIGYPDKLVASEIEMIRDGAIPKNVHFNVRRVATNELPMESEQLGIWLKELWREKEKKLETFYEKERAFAETECDDKCQLLGYYSSLSFWTVFSLIWTILIYEYRPVQLYAIICIGLYVILQTFYNGLEVLVIDQFYRHKNAHIRK